LFLPYSKNKPFLLHITKWCLSGAAIAVSIAIISTISARFDYALDDLEKPILCLVILMMISGFIYWLLLVKAKDTRPGRGLLAWVFLLGLVMRLLYFGSTPIQEDDFYRYLWDGGVAAKGHNPYRYAPKDIMDNRIGDIPDGLIQLGAEVPTILERINYPWLRTIYPPVSQAFFALAHMIRPWSMDAWRSVLLVLDIFTLFLLFLVLRRLKLPLIGLAIYWWNPLFIKEIYNSGHMDLLLFPFLLGSFLLTIQGRVLGASLILGLAVGVKFWPAILLPVVLRSVLKEPKRLVTALIVFSLTSGLTLLPMLLGGLDSRSGFVAYSRYWEMNDSFYMLLLWGVQYLTALISISFGSPHIMTRAIIVLVLALFIVFLVRRNTNSAEEISRRFLWPIAALYLFSPTQFPWYSLWMLPFLAIQPQRSLLLLTALLPLYYLRYFLAARDLVEVHDMGIVWLEFVPVWCLLIWEWYRRRKDKMVGGKTSEKL